MNVIETGEREFLRESHPYLEKVSIIAHFTHYNKDTLPRYRTLCSFVLPVVPTGSHLKCRYLAKSKIKEPHMSKYSRYTLLTSNIPFPFSLCLLFSAVECIYFFALIEPSYVAKYVGPKSFNGSLSFSNSLAGPCTAKSTISAYSNAALNTSPTLSRWFNNPSASTYPSRHMTYPSSVGPTCYIHVILFSISIPKMMIGYNDVLTNP